MKTKPSAPPRQSAAVRSRLCVILSFVTSTGMGLIKVTSGSALVLTSLACWVVLGQNYTRRTIATFAAAATTSRKTKDSSSALNVNSLPLPWKDVDWTQKGSCGVNKCFFRSTSNHTVGYLVANNGDAAYKNMRRATDLAQRLHVEFGAKHFDDIEFPYKVNITATLVPHLNRLVHQPLRGVVEHWGKGGVFQSNATVVVVQKLRIAPEPSLFVGVIAENHQVTLSKLQDFRQVIPDLDSFGRQFQFEITRIGKILEAYPKLEFDFQGLVDVHGNFYHMDLDAHFGRAPLPPRRYQKIVAVRFIPSQPSSG